MAKLRRVPIVFEAIILNREAVIYTRQGQTLPDAGEVVITGTGNEQYPIMPDVAVVNYEPADEAAVKYLRKHLPDSIGQEATDEYLALCEARAEHLRERLADLEHQQWTHWMEYVFSMCRLNDDGSLTIPVESLRHWQRQMETNYKDLSEREKDSDRRWAEMMIMAYRNVYDES